MGKKKGKDKRSPSLARRIARWTAVAIVASQLVLAGLGDWFVHHPREWIAAKCESLPRFVTTPLLAYGDRVGDFTDALGFTGTDVVYEYDEDAPNGSVFFAGEPKRVSGPAPSDIQVLQRGDFAVAWSPSLKHPVWVAYHVPPRGDSSATADPADPLKRPSFQKDRSVESSPSASAYEGSGYDRGHLAPNYAIATRFGEAAQKRTFLMTNIVPQTPSLNRGAWRDVEHRIASLWSGRYGEVWAIVGALPGRGERLPSGVEIPAAFYQVVVAQTEDGVRALAVVLPQNIPQNAYPTRYIVSIAELESLTGIDFLPELDSFIAKPLKAQTPTRMWPVGFLGSLKLIAARFR